MADFNVNEQNIFYVEQGKGSPVILIHGLAGDHSAWKPQMEALGKSYRIVALDNRGAGKSTQRDEQVSTEDMASDVLALMDHLNIERAQIVGRSMGGAIAQHMALLAPDRVQSLAVCASFAKLDPLGRRVLDNMRDVLEWTGSWAAHARHSVQNFVSPSYFNNYPERIHAIETLIGSDTRLQACYVQQNHACHQHDTLDQLRDIVCPTLVMAGACDPICSLTAAQWLADGVPNSRLEVFEDCSHFFLIEQAERFNSTLGDWLAQHEGS